MSGEGRILEAISRVMARLDGLERRLDELKTSLEALASTVYLQCLLERVKGKVVRSGLPARIDAVIVGDDGKLYVVKTRIVASYDTAEELRRIAPHVAGILGEESSEVIPVIVTSKYVGSEAPRGVDIVIC